MSARSTAGATRRLLAVGGIVALLAFGTLAGLAVVEIGMRSIGCVDRLGLGTNRRDRWYGWGNRAHIRTTVQRCLNGVPEFRATVRTNRWGHRGGDVAERA